MDRSEVANLARGMTGKVVRFPAAAFAIVGVALIATNVGALAYTSGSIGYDISYLQCGASATAARQASASTITTSKTAAVSSGATGSPLRQAVAAPRLAAQTSSSRTPWWSQPRNNTPPNSSIRIWYSQFTWGIVGVDSGFPFISTAHPGNPCLASEYRHTTSPGLYVNTGYDPSYTDTNHTTASCTTQSPTVSGNAAQLAAWAVGCSEAQDDYAYASSQGITSAEAWWLDVEPANSWCGQPGTNCTDLSLNRYTIQGLIDTFTHIGAVPVGIYSNTTMWSAITGGFQPTGATMDWYASGTSMAQTAKSYCTNSNSFSGAPVSIVQFVPNSSTDRDYAC